MQIYTTCIICGRVSIKNYHFFSADLKDSKIWNKKKSSYDSVLFITMMMMMWWFVYDYKTTRKKFIINFNVDFRFSAYRKQNTCVSIRYIFFYYNFIFKRYICNNNNNKLFQQFAKKKSQIVLLCFVFKWKCNFFIIILDFVAIQ